MAHRGVLINTIWMNHFITLYPSSSELVPRLLLQMSFLRCHKFVRDRSLLDANEVTESLTAEIRGAIQ